MRNQKRQAVGILGIPFIFFLVISISPLEAKEKVFPNGISPEKAADYVHAVIEAGRTIYSEVVVERMGFTIGLKASENWQKENTLPLPAQFLLLSATAASNNCQ